MTASRQVSEYLSLEQALSVVESFDIPVVSGAFVRSSAEAVAHAERIGFPVVLKVVSKDILHKSDSGGVRINIKSTSELTLAYTDMEASVRVDRPGARVDGFVVQRMAPAGIEVMVSVNRDGAFGPYLVIGMGGMWVEVLDDVQVGLLPASKEAICEWMDRLRCARLLKGYRGGPNFMDPVADIAYRLGKAFLNRMDILEVELNPVIITDYGIHVVDARILSGPPARQPKFADRASVGSALSALRLLTTPKSVAVVGASTKIGKIGNPVVEYMNRHGLPPHLFPVNVTESDVLGHKAYASLDSVPEEISIACLAVPAEAAMAAVPACTKRGAKVAVVFSAGFAEAGQEERQKAFVQSAHSGGMRVLGPNSIGVISPANKTFISFSQCLETPEPLSGDVGLISQSGALMGSVLSQAWGLGLGFSHCFSTGNEADLDAADCIDFLAKDSQTRVIAAFLEGIRNGDKFRRALHSARKAGKPVVIYKLGRSESARAVVQSHTANLVGVDAVFNAVLREADVIRVTDFYGLYDTALALSWLKLPASDRVAALSSSGGACGVVADQLDQVGLKVPALSQESQSRLRAIIPDSGIVRNPIDVTGVIVTRPQMLAEALAIVDEDSAVDSVAMVMTTVAGTLADHMSEMLVDCISRCSKPVFFSWTIGQGLIPGALGRLRKARIPVFQTPERAVRALRNLITYQEDRYGGVAPNPPNTSGILAGKHSH